MPHAEMPACINTIQDNITHYSTMLNFGMLRLLVEIDHVMP